MKFQQGGLPQVFNVDQGFAQPIRVNLAPVIGATSMELDAGVKAHSVYEKLRIQHGELDLHRDAEERMKRAEKINNLKLISELSEKAGTISVLPGKQDQLNQILGPLSDPNMLMAASQDVNKAAEYIAQHTSAMIKARPLVREKLSYEQARKEWEEANDNLLKLAPQGTAHLINPEFMQKLDEWGDKIKAFGEGDPSLKETDILASSNGMGELISKDNLVAHVEQAKKTKALQDRVLEVNAKNLEQEALKKQADNLAELSHAAKRAGLADKPFDQYTPDEQQKIYQEIGKREFEDKEATRKMKIAQANSLAAKTSLEQIPYFVALNDALPLTAQLKSLDDIGRIGEIYNSLSASEKDDFNRAWMASSIIDKDGKTSADWNSFVKAYPDCANFQNSPECLELFRQFKGRDSGVSHSGTSRKIDSKTGEIVSLKVNGTTIVNGNTKDTRLPDGVTFTEIDGKGYVKIAHGDDPSRRKFMQNTFGIDMVADFWSLEFGNLEIEDVLPYREDNLPKGSFNKDGFLYIPEDGDSAASTPTTKNTGKPATGKGAPNYVPKKPTADAKSGL